jgi:hypothetical protein
MPGNLPIAFASCSTAGAENGRESCDHNLRYPVAGGEVSPEQDLALTRLERAVEDAAVRVLPIDMELEDRPRFS